MTYLFQNATAFDPYTAQGVPNASGQVFAMSDTAFATPLTVILLSSGLQTTELVSDQYSQLPGFDAGDHLQVRFRSGEFTKILNTSTPLVGPQGDAGKSAFEVAVEGGYAGTEAEYNASLTDAPNLVTRAETAETAAVNAANLVGAPADTAIATAINGPGTQTQTALSAAIDPKVELKLDKAEAASTYVDRFRSDTGRIALGVGALGSLPDSYNVGVTGVVVALGYEALGKATQVKQSIAIGNKALGSAIMSRDNIAIGDQSLQHLQADSPNYDQANKGGTRNVAIGGLAGHFVNKGWAHTLIGRGAGQCVDNGTGLVAIGANAASGEAPVGFSGEVENGAPWNLALDAVVRSVIVGNSAATSTTASQITAIGGGALLNNKKSEFNTAVGTDALKALDTATGPNGGTQVLSNIPGTYSHSGNVLTISAAAHGLVVGDISYTRLTSGDSQTLQTDRARAVVLTVPDANTYTVSHPVSRVASGEAIFMGKETGAQRARSQENVAVGTNAAASVLAGGENVFVGANTTTSATQADRSTVVGKQALARTTNTQRSTVVGYYAAGFIAAGATEVTALGANALRVKVDGSSMTESWDNITALGYDSRVTGANQVQLGDSRTTTYAYGTIQNRSDLRDKADVRDTLLGLEFINKLRPVDYKWDMRDDYVELDSDGNATLLPKDGSKKRNRFHHGVIAQELPEEFGGVQDHSMNGGSDVMSVGYDELIAPLIKAVQELSAQVAELKSQLPR